MRIVSIGEILWDVFPSGEHLGGAAFNFSAHARRLGDEVLFLSAVGKDERGRAALAKAGELGLGTEFIREVEDTATGIVSVTVDPDGQPSFTIHRPAAYDCLELDANDMHRIAAFSPHWIYFGTLYQMVPQARELARHLMVCVPEARRFYDVNLRKDSYTPELVKDLLALADAVKLNEDEVAKVDEMLGARHGTLESFCRSRMEEFGWQAVCVTRGGSGCAILTEEGYVEVAGYRVKVQDTVGAGDSFAAAFVHGLEKGWPAAQIGDFANRVGALVASRAGGTPEWTPDECYALSPSLRSVSQ